MEEKLESGIIVSCQPAFGNEQFYDYEFIKRMAKAAEFGGSVAVRIEGVENVRRLIHEISLPVIGLVKNGLPINDLGKRCITSKEQDILDLYDSGARIIAVDFTFREAKNASYYANLIDRIRALKGLQILADVSTIEEAVMAMECGVDYVSSTLVGYTDYTSHVKLPDLEIIKQFSESLSIPFFAEGGFSSAKDVCRALAYNAYGVVIGTAITRPHIVTKKYTDLFNQYKHERIIT